MTSREAVIPLRVPCITFLLQLDCTCPNGRKSVNILCKHDIKRAIKVQPGKVNRASAWEESLLAITWPQPQGRITSKNKKKRGGGVQ